MTPIDRLSAEEHARVVRAACNLFPASLWESIQRRDRDQNRRILRLAQLALDTDRSLGDE